MRGAVGGSLRLRRVAPRGAAEDFRQVVGGGKGNVDLEEEAVELRLGQGVGALHFQRVLGRQDKEGLRQGVGLVGDGHRMLLHRLQQRRLRLGRGAIDFVGQDQVGKDGAALEAEAALPVAVLEYVRAGDVGRHQVRRELDAAELQAQRVGQGANEHRLAQAGDAFQQRVAAGEDGHQHIADHVLLADDDLADLRFDVGRGFAVGGHGELWFGGRDGGVGKGRDVAHRLGGAD